MPSEWSKQKQAEKILIKQALRGKLVYTGKVPRENPFKRACPDGARQRKKAARALR